MQNRLSTAGATIGMAVGIVVIAGSIVGGIALAADRGRGQAPTTGDTAVTVGNHSNETATPDPDRSTSANATTATTATTATNSGNGSSVGARDAGSPRSTPTAGSSTVSGPTPSPPTAGPTVSCDDQHGCATDD